MPEPLYVCLLVLRRELQIPLGPPEQVLQHTALHAIHLIGQEALRGNAEVEADNFQRIKTYGGALSFDGIDGRLCDADLFSLENAACDLLPRSVFMFFDSFFDSSTKITSD